MARYCNDQGLLPHNPFNVSTLHQDFEATVNKETIELAMGTPHLQQISLPMAKEAVWVSLGNPHLILLVPDIAQIRISKRSAAIQAHLHKPANIGFMQVLDPHNVLLRTYERGVGETLACGSNACAAVAVGIEHGLLAKTVHVHFKRGALQVRWAGGTAPIYQRGEAVYVFKGEVSF